MVRLALGVALGVALAGLALAAAPAAGQQPADTTARAVKDRMRERARIGERIRPQRVGAPADSAPAVVQDTQAAPMPPMQRDSIMEELLRLEGYVATEYQGAGARFDADSGRLELAGKAQVGRAEQTMTADSVLVYDSETSIVCGYGNPVLSGTSASPVQSDRVCYNIERRRGMALGARTKFSESATWFVHGEQVFTTGSEVLYGRHADFTSCDLEVPHYHFSAAEVKIVHEELMVARNVTLNFADVPVFWLPFMVQNLKEGRRSGLLTPSVGVNDIARTSSGYNRSISDLGFYWAINDYLGAQAALEWYSEHWTALSSTFQYRWLRQFLAGGVNLRQYWQDGGGSELNLASNNSWRPGERTSVSLNANYASSSAFVRRNTFDPRELNRTIESNASVTHSFERANMSLGARRKQYLTEDRVELGAPSVSLSLSPITFFPAGAGQPRWYQDASWVASTSFSQNSIDVNEDSAVAALRDSKRWNGNLNSTFRMGRLGWNQSMAMNEAVFYDKPGFDTVSALPRTVEQNLNWSSSLNFQQRLIGSTTFTPGVSVQGMARKGGLAGADYVSGPLRLSVNSQLKMDLFGFWPGFGPFSRVRHLLSPTLTHSYSPRPSTSQLQQDVFGATQTREQNVLQLGITQVFEAKYEAEETADTTAVPADTTAAADGAPRRLTAARKVRLLTLNASPIQYDFVKERETGNGFVNDRVVYGLRSDLVQGLDISLTQQLFRGDTAGADPDDRVFDPRLAELTAAFSIGSQSRLFRFLGLGGRDQPDEGTPADSAVDPETLLPLDQGAIDLGSQRVSGSNVPESAPLRRSGSWQASLRYSLVRDDPFSSLRRESQMLRGNLTFQPTENWSVQWNTGYSFTDGEFSEHILTLTRDLHRWQANFNFMKAPNGNWQMRFYVELRDNRDLQVEYEQRGTPVTD